jgi:hypothetical protein
MRSSTGPRSAAAVTSDGNPRGFPRETCASCHADIVWARTTSGAAMPVDAEPTRGANVRLRWENSDARAEVVKAALAFGSTGLHLSHFVTCPKADQWRRRGGKAFDQTAARRHIRGK